MSLGASIRVLPDGLELEPVPGHDLFRILADAGIGLNQACGGRGLCGKCRVRISERVPSPSHLDRRHLSQREIDRGIRLACGLEPRGGEIVELPPATKVIHKPSHGARQFSVDPWPGTDAGDLALAVDLGTTNIAGYLLETKSGKIVASSSTANSQATFGADVMTRLSYASAGGAETRERMRNLALKDMETLVTLLTGEAPKVRHVVAVMNTAMETLLLGLDPDRLGRHPYDSGILTAVHTKPFSSVLPGDAALHIPCIVGGFVGSDTVAALIAVEALENPNRPYLLIDIGTNSESVLVTDEQITACSSAAGPAFEGGNISCGMRAVAGAVEHAEVNGGTVRYTVIGGKKAMGITGSGLFSLLGSLIRAGALDRFGMMVGNEFGSGQIRTGSGGRELSITPDVSLNEADIQQFMLAKASARASADILLKEAELHVDAITKVYLCGTFAYHIQPADILSLGMMPSVEPETIVGLGNMAGSGAAMMASSREVFEQACALAGTIRHLSLSAHPDFNRVFQEHVRFP